MGFRDYKSTAFDEARLRRFARHVASLRAGTPPSMLAAMVEETRTVKGLFRSRTETSHVQGRVAAPGWILVVDRYEGWFTVTGGIYGNHRAFEEGRLLLLDDQGELLSATYTVEFYRVAQQGRSWSRHEISTPAPVGAEGLLTFDRINRAHYTDRRKRDGELYRSEMGRNFRVKWPHPGMETSLALKNFKERGTYFAELPEPG